MSNGFALPQCSLSLLLHAQTSGAFLLFRQIFQALRHRTGKLTIEALRWWTFCAIAELREKLFIVGARGRPMLTGMKGGELNFEKIGGQASYQIAVILDVELFCLATFKCRY